MDGNGVDPVVGLAKVLSIVITATTASIIAPHLVVFIAGSAGSIVSLMSWRKCSIAEGLGYVMLFGVLAWLFAGNLIDLVASFWPIATKWPASMSALGIGSVGHRWPLVFKWVGGLLRTAVEAAASKGDKA